MRKSVLFLTTLLASGSGAFAQTAPATSMAPAQGITGLDEVVVTAQRHAEDQEHAPIALSVLRGSDLADAGVVTAERLQTLVPALTVEPTSTGNIIFVRGVGNFTVVPSSDPAIAFNYDGVYVGRPTSTSGVFYDLDRVEVLKGPQGILYGRNATGGAINVLPTQPQIGGGYSGYGSFSYGDYNSVVAQGAVNMPLSDTAALRVAASESHHDGYLKDGEDDDATSSVRIQLKDEVTPDLTVRIAADLSHTGGTGQGVSYLNAWSCPNNPAAAAVGSQAAACSIHASSGINLDQGVYSPNSQAWRVTNNIGGPAVGLLPLLSPTPFVNDSFYGVNAEISYDTGFGELTILPAWRLAKQNLFSDAAAFDAGNVEKDQQVSTEVRFTGKRIGFLDYTVGFYYFDEKINDAENINLVAQGIWTRPNYGTESYAPFAEATVNVNDDLRLVSGARFTEDHKTLNSDTITLQLVCVVAIGNVCASHEIPYVQNFADLAGSYFTSLPALGTPLKPVTTLLTAIPGLPDYLQTTENPQNLSLNNSRATYREALDWDVTPNSLAYASYETGYRSGGFSGSYAYPTYQPEYITAYTVGSKNRFFDRRLQLNLEAFRWNYDNQQVNHVSLDPITGSSANFTSNVGKSIIQGGEIDATALLTPTTLVSADFQYLDAVYQSYVYSAAYTVTPTGVASPLTGCPAVKAAAPAPAPAGTYVWNINCSGMQAYNSPKWTINLAVQQTVGLESMQLPDYEVLLSANAQYKSTYDNGFAYLSDATIKDTWNLDAMAQFEPKDGNWTIGAFVRNITNNQTPLFSTTNPFAGLSVATISAPRTFGFRVSKKF